MLPPVSLPGRANQSTLPMIPATVISPGLLQTLRVPLGAGRFFDSRQSRKDEVIVSEEFARRLFPGENPVGQRIEQKGIQEIMGVGIRVCKVRYRKICRRCIGWARGLGRTEPS